MFYTALTTVLMVVLTGCGSAAFKGGALQSSDSSTTNPESSSDNLKGVNVAAEYTTTTTDEAGTGGESPATDNKDKGHKDQSGGEEQLPGDGDSVTSDETADCAKLAGVDVKTIKIAGSGHLANLTSGDAVAIKVTGNKNTLKLKLSTSDGSAIKAICVFTAGNHASVSIDMSADVGALYYKGRGNQSYGLITVAAEHKLTSAYFDMAGNAATAKVTGPGSYTCDSTSLKGHETQVSCTE